MPAYDDSCTKALTLEKAHFNFGLLEPYRDAHHEHVDDRGNGVLPALGLQAHSRRLAHRQKTSQSVAPVQPRERGSHQHDLVAWIEAEMEFALSKR